MRKFLTLTAALAAIPFLGLAAQAAPCVPGSVASYEALGATGCSVGPVTFSSINVTWNAGVDHEATATFNPVTFTGPTGETEYGLALNFLSTASNGGQSDVSWTYIASAQYLHDAVLILNSAVVGNAIAGATETITGPASGDTNLAVINTSNNQANTDIAFFSPTETVFVTKDSFNFTGEGGFSTSSVLINAWSVTGNEVPLPGALPLFVSGLGALGFAGWRKRKSAKGVAA